jgi:Zn-dependent protease
VSVLAPSSRGPGLELRILGVPVRLEVGFFVIAAYLGLGVGDLSLMALWIGVVTVSVLVHEGGHAVAMRLAGLRPRIVLQPFGGVTIGSGPLDGPHSIAVSLAGPLTALVLLGVPAWWIEHQPGAPSGTAGAAVTFLIWVNVFWSLANLLPIVPLDGGHITEILLGKRASLVTSVVVGAAAALLALWSGLVFAGLFAGLLAFASYGELRRPPPHRSTPALQERAEEAGRALRAGDYDRARRAAELLRTEEDPRPRAMGVEVEAWCRLAAGDREGAIRILRDLPEGQHPSGHLVYCLKDTGTDDVDLTVQAWRDGALAPPPLYARCVVARGSLGAVTDLLLANRSETGALGLAVLQHDLFHAGLLDASAWVGQRIVDEGQGDVALAAYNTACAHARAGRVTAALDALEAARTSGFADTELLDTDPDLTPLRHEPRFIDLRQGIGSHPTETRPT